MNAEIGTFAALAVLTPHVARGRTWATRVRRSQRDARPARPMIRTRRLPRHLLALAWSVLTAVVVAVGCRGEATGQEGFDRDRFELFTECAPVGLFVTVEGSQAEEMGLTEERVRTMAESRLRGARLYTSAPPYFQVNIGTLDNGPAYMMSAYLWKRLRDMNGYEAVMPAWYRATFGTDSGDAGFLMQSLSEMLDRFIAEYLRVNEDHC